MAFAVGNDRCHAFNFFKAIRILCPNDPGSERRGVPAFAAPIGKAFPDQKNSSSSIAQRQ